MERVIVEKLNSHLELNNLISDHQHGFRKNRSTVSQLVVIHDYIQSTLDRGIPIDIILIDLLKAFDRISLRKLIHCLEIYGIKGQLKNWLSAYLNDRKIAVKVADTLSTWTDATSGVPQGSVLGPVLFVMYIDICINAISQTDFGLFADDTKLLGEAGVSSQIQSDLDALTEKLEEWQLSPNLAKCSVVHLGRQNPMYSYKMKGIDLTKSTCEKDLGVILSLDLKPEKYIGLVMRKASNTLWLLSQSLRYLDNHSKISAYTSYVRPQLEYATVIWSPYLKKDIDRIERVQKRFVKGLQGFRNLPYDEALRRLTLHKLETRRTILDLKTLFKIVHENFGNVKDKLVQITPQSNTRSHSLQLEPVKMKIARSNSYQHSFIPRVIRIWNKLPFPVEKMKSLEAFSNSLNINIPYLETFNVGRL